MWNLALQNPDIRINSNKTNIELYVDKYTYHHPICIYTCVCVYICAAGRKVRQQWIAQHVLQMRKLSLWAKSFSLLPLRTKLYSSFPGMSPNSSAVFMYTISTLSVFLWGDLLSAIETLEFKNSSRAGDCWTVTQMNVRTTAECLWHRKCFCIFSFADASYLLIPVNRLLQAYTLCLECVPYGQDAASWHLCLTIKRKIKTTSSAFMDQPDSDICWKNSVADQHPCCCALINLSVPKGHPLPGHPSREKSTGPTRVPDCLHTTPCRDLAIEVRYNSGAKSEFGAFTTDILLHCAIAIWILKIVPSHFATLSASLQDEVMEFQKDFTSAYGCIGMTSASANPQIADAWHTYEPSCY